MHKNAMKCNETLTKWCKNKHGASKIIDTLETYQSPPNSRPDRVPEQSFWFQITVSDGGGTAELYLEKTSNPR
jgi:hypothetical protein